MFSALSRIVPPPTYITMPAVGVDISDASLKYVKFKPTSRNEERKLVEWGDIAIPSGVVERGSVLDQKQLVAVLKEFKTKTGAEYVRLSLPEERAYLFETKVKANMPLKEIRSLLEFRLEENVPIPSKEVLFDYTILPANSNDERESTISVVAYSRETIQAYHDSCREAGLRPLNFEVEAQSMARAMVPKDMSGTVMIVDFGKTRTGIGIVNKGTLMYTSTVDLGGNDLSKSLRKVIGDKTESELTQIKNNSGLVRGLESGEVRESLLTAVSIIKDEIATRMQYWNMRNGANSRRIEQIILCGGSSNLHGLPEYLSESLDVPTIRGNVWENSFSLENSIPEIDLRHSYGYAAAVGLALRNIV